MKLFYTKFITIFLLLLAMCSLLMLTGAVKSVYADCPPDMIFYWKFEEESCNVYYDHNGTNDGECSGVCPVYTSSGMINGGQVFDGETVGINVQADTFFNWGLNDSFSIEYLLLIIDLSS